MEIQSASEAIDGDADTDDTDPDSMDILMGEIEIPFEPLCDMQKVDTNIEYFNFSQCSKEKSETKRIFKNGYIISQLSNCLPKRIDPLSTSIKKKC